jgi:hypothetical protein
MAAHRRKKSSLVFLRKIKDRKKDGELGRQFYERQVTDDALMHI